MSNFSSKQRLILGITTGVAVAIFLAARSAASWRPQFIGIQSLTHQPPLLYVPPPAIDGGFMDVSPDGEWLRIEYLGSKQRIWSTTAHTSRACDLEQIRFSSDSRTLLGFRIRPLVHGPKVGSGFSVVLQTPEGKELWATPPKHLYRERPVQLQFAGDTVEAITTSRIYSFDLQTGAIRRISQRPPNMQVRDAWNYADKFKSPDGSKTYSTSEIKDSRKVPTRKYQVDVSNTVNFKKLWSYPAIYSSHYQLTCSPQWEDGGKALATIENNTLFLRDAQTGKILISYNSRLPAPLKSWAFTKSRDTVYLLDATGRIFRQRLR